MANASARLTVGALLGAVTTAANTITTSLDTITDGVGMINTFVNDAATKQSIRSVVDMEGFESALQEEKSQEMTARQLSVLQFCNQSPDHARLYQANYDRIGQILTARRAAHLKAA